jgi:endoglucanase
VLERLEQVIAAASERGLAVVVANLRVPQLMADPPSHRERRLLASTQQLAEAIKHHGPSVALEPLSEPQLELDRVWNRYLSELCATVREVDPGRTVVIGPRSYNNARFLGELELPEKESSLILTVHQYWPITFTMQGESWLGQTELGDPTTWLETTWDGTPQQRAGPACVHRRVARLRLGLLVLRAQLRALRRRHHRWHTELLHALIPSTHR